MRLVEYHETFVDCSMAWALRVRDCLPSYACLCSNNVDDDDDDDDDDDIPVTAMQIADGPLTPTQIACANLRQSL